MRRDRVVTERGFLADRGLGRWRQRAPVGAGPSPGVLQVGGSVVAAEKDHLVGRGVIGKRGSRTHRRARRRDELGPGGASPGPCVAQVGAPVVTAEEHQLVRGRVVAQRGVVARRWVRRRSQLGPGGAGPDPRVGLGGAVRVAAEHDRLAGTGVICERGGCADTRAGGRTQLGPRRRRCSEGCARASYDPHNKGGKHRHDNHEPHGPMGQDRAEYAFNLGARASTRVLLAVAADPAGACSDRPLPYFFVTVRSLGPGHETGYFRRTARHGADLADLSRPLTSIPRSPSGAKDPTITPPVTSERW